MLILITMYTLGLLNLDSHKNGISRSNIKVSLSSRSINSILEHICSVDMCDQTFPELVDECTASVTGVRYDAVATIDLEMTVTSETMDDDNIATVPAPEAVDVYATAVVLVGEIGDDDLELKRQYGLTDTDRGTTNDNVDFIGVLPPVLSSSPSAE
jgi:hypothetical protein